ncbi:DUF2306 domain-containing protein [Pseudoalteromonas luteoviolacea]|uniref:DUF2306 domain-containing protein n=1 Tax=Pseudoalteromonas luteoviolacea S4054 TaxID=1129367 RepID=A0A0F6AFF3_9GAMM|nr:DUF2306 domain-containing protein [Pseudoalteromonas luteoviolacea]AOT10030.1 hypothetical protein S4054249_20405 [Pseudoalteromonas luteoviolacea]AOT14941.1 hypothetical protein S40542_20375 [Pseudoalteromonas luteoviolacea]AOT19857.1 hypothetical protein S4054_20380 [Pseudoalteromonas luteoviolacea]KKE84888.1 hypothetical protein N479_07260 [Pseudoalteromonas luteoviolacea S4054]KZN72505.1 hypothetical protein N481_14850 [Pseudoalteromonas luteoviolacea S4047-1]
MHRKNQPTAFNWPVVSGLLLIMAIPGLPAIIIIALVLLGQSDVFGMADVINPQYLAAPAAILTHATAGVTFFLTMPWQFSPRLRMRYPRWHMRAGRIAVISGCAMALSGIWLHLVLSPDELGGRFVSLVVMSIAIVGAFSVAVWHIVRGQVDQHKKWMVRAVAISLAAITPLFIGAIVHVVLSHWQDTFGSLLTIYHDYDRLIAMFINLLVIEWLSKEPHQTGVSNAGIVSVSPHEK